MRRDLAELGVVAAGKGYSSALAYPTADSRWSNSSCFVAARAWRATAADWSWSANAAVPGEPPRPDAAHESSANALSAAPAAVADAPAPGRSEGFGSSAWPSANVHSKAVSTRSNDAFGVTAPLRRDTINSNCNGARAPALLPALTNGHGSCARKASGDNGSPPPLATVSTSRHVHSTNDCVPRSADAAPPAAPKSQARACSNAAW
mmetsp:Transcript_17371/g.47351  ORF Transcript_17371/g.47351 Transcript_17371/m.47351 type:complete len:206 (-) Transcript_17371:1342-1959(-)